MIDDGLYQRVKEIAVTHKRTVTSLVEEALTQLADSYESTAPTRGRFYFNAVGTGGLQPGIDPTNNAQINAMLDEEDLRAKGLWPYENA